MENQIRLDFRSGVSIYIQLVEQIQNLVVNGSLKPGDQLPTVRHLASELDVNFNTVARAYRLLDEAGLISTQQGRGTYILKLPDEVEHDRLRRQMLKSLTSRYLSKAARLGFSYEEVRTDFDDQFDNWRQGAQLDEDEVAEEED